MELLAGLLLGILASALLGGAVFSLLLKKSRRLERRTAESERLAELGLLTGGLAHELKNPLSTLQLNLQLLREDLEDRQRTPGGQTSDPQLARMVRRLHGLNAETNRLRAILDDFLRYAGRVELDRRPTDLGQLAEELVDFLSPQAQLAKVRVEVRVRTGSTEMEVDPRLLKQALLNLLLNAIQHTPQGGTVAVEISTGKAARGGRPHIRLEVSDTGRGIPAEDLPRVFEPYFSRRKGGTGLGLPTTRRIIQAHGGEISVQSDPASGSRFIVTLPSGPHPGGSAEP
jgi:signal transduction histidine kinase